MRKPDLSDVSGLMVYLALIGSAAAVAGEVPLPLMAVFGCAFAGGLVLDRSRKETPFFNPLLLLALVMAGIVIALWALEADLFNRALGILFIIISAKLLSPKRGRDLLQLYLLNFLVVAAAAVTRWGIEFGMLVLLEAFLCVTGLMFLHGSREQAGLSRSQIRPMLGWSVLITIALIPATVFLFLIIPRPTGMFFAWGKRAEGRTGFGDRVSPGVVEEIKTDPSPAFRVRWLKGRPPRSPLWRGVVYDTYRGGVWEKQYGGSVALPDGWGEEVEYEVLIEPNDQEYLLSFGLPSRVLMKPERAVLSPGFTLRVPRRLSQRTLYRVRAFDVKDFPVDLPPSFFLETPKEVAKGLAPLAKRLTKGGALPSAQAIATYLKRTFRYSLSPGVARGDPVLYFMFTGKKGHCEYFASAMVLLLRSLGIPARIVGGYLGGEWNEMGRYYLVRHSDAHTWVEVWQEGRGWVVFDPTPSGAPKEGKPFLRGKLFRLVDFLRLKWYYWVLDYDLNRQLNLARTLTSFFRSLRSGGSSGISIKARDLFKLAPLLMIVILVVAFKVARSLYRKRPRTWGERFLRVLERRGYTRREGETLLELACRVAGEDREFGGRALAFVRKYYVMEYGRREREAGSLERLLREMGKKPGVCAPGFPSKSAW